MQKYGCDGIFVFNGRYSGDLDPEYGTGTATGMLMATLVCGNCLGLERAIEVRSIAGANTEQITNVINDMGGALLDLCPFKNQGARRVNIKRS